MTTTEIITFLTREQAHQGITDVQLCKDIGVHKVTLWRVKTGVTAVTNKQIVDIAHRLGYSIELIKL